MNEPEIQGNIRTLYQKIVYLQAELTALRGISAVLIQKHSGNELDAIHEEITQKAKLEYDRLISDIENENPALAAYLDFREELNNKDRDAWYFPSLGEDTTPD